jgi:hypothetical protein
LQRNTLPSFLMSSVPKSGTHLLEQILLGMPGVTFQSRGKKNKFFKGKEETDYVDHLSRLKSLKPSEFGRGHLYYDIKYANMLKALNMKHVFIHRDPRDVVVSWAFFIVNKYHKHPLYPYFMNVAKTDKERYLALIRGVDPIWKMDFGHYIRPYYGWLNDSNTFSLTYEEIMGSRKSRLDCMTNLAAFLWKGKIPPIPIHEMVNLMDKNINPESSPTFRKGKIGNWQGAFDKETKHAFKEVAGDLIIELGYERNNNW